MIAIKTTALLAIQLLVVSNTAVSSPLLRSVKNERDEATAPNEEKEMQSWLTETNIVNEQGDDSFEHLMQCLWNGGSNSKSCHNVTDCSWCVCDKSIPNLCVSPAYAAHLDGDVCHCDVVGSPSPTITPGPTAAPTKNNPIPYDDDQYFNDDDQYFNDDDDHFPNNDDDAFQPTTPDKTTAPTPAPTTGAPTMMPSDDTDDYSKHLLECLQKDKADCDGKKKNTTLQCVWCESEPMRGLCFSEAAAIDYDGGFYTCHWKKHHHHHHHHHSASPSAAAVTPATTAATTTTTGTTTLRKTEFIMSGDDEEYQ